MTGLMLYPHQVEAAKEMVNGCILDGDTGSGKSMTSIAYYFFKVCDGRERINGRGKYRKMRYPRDLYIITTAKKRDDKDWEKELLRFRLIKGKNELHDVTIVIDSWNVISKYADVRGAFFIFDEQRVSGSGKWVKTFLKIAKHNMWVLLSATPGDSWKDYIPVFVANGFYKNKSDFSKQHIVYSRFAKYPKIEGYYNEGVLLKHKKDITIHMEVERETVPHDIPLICSYDKSLYRRIWKERCDPFNDDEPIDETSKLFYLLRKVVNDDTSRCTILLEIFRNHKKLIVFYNFTYELERLRELFRVQSVPIGEWNGQVHSEVPGGESWVYLVQYSAGCEGWNCVETDTIVFYSQSYSYKMTKQAKGRIDRLNTPYKDLYYYFLRSSAPIDIAISRALSKKKDFNEKRYLGRTR